MASLSLLSPRFHQRLADLNFTAKTARGTSGHPFLAEIYPVENSTDFGSTSCSMFTNRRQGDDATLMVLRFGESDDSTIRIDLRPRDWGQPPPQPPGQDSSGFSGGRCSRTQHIDPQPDENPRRGPMAPPIH